MKFYDEHFFFVDLEIFNTFADSAREKKLKIKFTSWLCDFINSKPY